MAFRFSFLTILWFGICPGSPASANTYLVAATGNDGNNCVTASTPCQTISAAIQKASANDTIFCLTPIADGALDITKSLDINCAPGATIVQSFYVDNNEQIRINIPVSSGDPLRTVRLRGLSLVSWESGGVEVRIDHGIDIQAAAVVILEDTTISGCAKQGIINEGAQTRLYVTNSTIHNCGGPGIVSAAAAPGVTVLDHVHLENNGYGLAAAAGNNVTIKGCVISGNSIAGVEADGGSQVIVDGSAITNNDIGIQSNQTIRLSNNDIAFNNTAISGSSGTFGNNRFSGNVSMGTAPSPLGGVSSDFAQQ